VAIGASVLDDADSASTVRALGGKENSDVG
jgi:hypothetical protein